MNMGSKRTAAIRAAPGGGGGRPAGRVGSGRRVERGFRGVAAPRAADTGRTGRDQRTVSASVHPAATRGGRSVSGRRHEPSAAALRAEGGCRHQDFQDVSHAGHGKHLHRVTHYHTMRGGIEKIRNVYVRHNKKQSHVFGKPVRGPRQPPAALLQSPGAAAPPSTIGRAAARTGNRRGRTRRPALLDAGAFVPIPCTAKRPARSAPHPVAFETRW